MDPNFYYNSSAEPRIKNWRAVGRPGTELILRFEFSTKINSRGARLFGQESAPPPDLDDFLPGAGSGKWPPAGRFGFTKEDRGLDCAMPIPGIIDRMYRCGHPFPDGR
jgi:hypothetical protein